MLFILWERTLPINANVSVTRCWPIESAFSTDVRSHWKKIENPKIFVWRLKIQFWRPCGKILLQNSESFRSMFENICKSIFLQEQKFLNWFLCVRKMQFWQLWRILNASRPKISCSKSESEKKTFFFKNLFLLKKFIYSSRMQFWWNCCKNYTKNPIVFCSNLETHYKIIYFLKNISSSNKTCLWTRWMQFWLPPKFFCQKSINFLAQNSKTTVNL